MTSSAFLPDPDASRIMAGSLAAMFLGSKARMTEEVRAKAKALLDPVLRNVPILSTDKSNGGLYTKYTGYTQEYLEEWWDVKKKALTGCNPFVGWYSGNLLGSNLGGFQLDTILKGLGKLHTWVKSSSGYQPGYGDICLHTGRGHMSICLGISGGRRKAVQGGMGGSRLRYDSIDKSDDPWNPSAIEGWVDIESYRAQKDNVPDWLQGWWEVTFRGDTYYYYFDLKRQVKWSEMRPRDIFTPMLATDGGVGTFSNAGTEVTVRWRSGTVEKYTATGQDFGTMNGTYNGTETITAERM